jgi:hypothetical protein
MNRWRSWYDVKPLYFSMENLGYYLVSGGRLSRPFKLIWKKGESILQFDWWDDLEVWLKDKGEVK